MTLIYNLFIFFVSVSAHALDDQSLMQQGVGIESAAVSQYKQNLKVVTDTLKEIQFPGKMRQMAIDALVRSVSKSERIDNTTNHTLGMIQNMLDKVRDEYVEERDAANRALVILAHNIEICNNRSLALEASHAAKRDEAKTNYTDCLAIEQSWYDGAANSTAEMSSTGIQSIKETCGALQSVVNTFTTTKQADCTAVENAVANAVSQHQGPPVTLHWEAHEFFEVYGNDVIAGLTHIGGIWGQTIEDLLEDAKDSFNELYVTLVAETDKCDDSHQKLKEQEDKCTPKYYSHEAAFCEWHATIDQVCISDGNQPGGCWYIEVGVFNTQLNNLTAVANERISVMEIVELVDCLIDQLRRNADEDADADTVYFAFNVSNCHADAIAMDLPSIYNLTNPGYNPWRGCSTWDDELPMGDGGGATGAWNQQEYPNYGSWSTNWPRKVLPAPINSTC